MSILPYRYILNPSLIFQLHPPDKYFQPPTQKKIELPLTIYSPPLSHCKILFYSKSQTTQKFSKPNPTKDLNDLKNQTPPL